ncbi:rRNA processing/ribosome biogenesis-domain-containing protein [Dipodascopsis tothii]|uniref:rRNA processing/ribosome biogenesis-domain-containing protein n=1 Tax=Dipodascopsis tothii TaxID=44089 RepID=UPI0034CD7C9B
MAGLSGALALVAIDREGDLDTTGPFAVGSVDGRTVAAADAAAVAKLRGRAAALAAARTPAARRTGLQLMAALLRADWETVGAHAAPWLRIVVPLVQRPDAETVADAIAAATAVLETAHGKPTVVREAVTPALPALTTALVAAAETAPAESLAALATAIQLYPTTSRPAAGKARGRAAAVLNGGAASAQAAAAATTLLAVVHRVGKDPAAEWRADVLATVRETQTAVAGALAAVDRPFAAEAGWADTVAVDGPIAGAARVETLVAVLRALLAHAPADGAQVPLGELVGLADSVLAVDGRAEFRPTAGRSDRDLALVAAARAQTALCGLLADLARGAGPLLAQHTYTLVAGLAAVPSLAWPPLDAAARAFLAAFLPAVGALPADLVPELAPHVDGALACLDPAPAAGAAALADFTTAPAAFARAPTPAARAADVRFLTAVVRHVPALARGLRARVDRFAVRNAVRTPADEELLAACVLYPGDHTRYSVLPLAASRLPPTSMWLDCLVHPRLPPTQLPTAERRAAVGLDDLDELAAVPVEAEAEAEPTPEPTPEPEPAPLPARVELATTVAVPAYADSVRAAATATATATVTATAVVAVEPVEPVLPAEALPAAGPAALAPAPPKRSSSPPPDAHKRQKTDDDSDFEMPEIDVGMSSDDD